MTPPQRRALARLDKPRRRVLCGYCAHEIARVSAVDAARHLIMPLAMTKAGGVWRKTRLRRPVRPGLPLRDRDGQVIDRNVPPGDVHGRVEWDLPADVVCPHCGWRQRLDAATLDVVSGLNSAGVLLMRDVAPADSPARSAAGARRCPCAHTLAEHVRGALNDGAGGRCLVDGCTCMRFRQSAPAHQAARTRAAVGAHETFFFFSDSARLPLDNRRPTTSD